MFEEMFEMRRTFLAIKSGDQEIDHIWNYKIAKVMRMFAFWATSEEYARMPLWWKIWNRLQFPLLFAMWIMVSIRLYQDYKVLPIPKIAELISISVGGCLTFISSIRYNMCRDLLSGVITVADEKYLAIPKDTPRYKEYQKKMRREYVLEGQILTSCCIMGACIALPQVVFMFVTGQLFYATILPEPETPFDLKFFLQLPYQCWNPFVAGIYYTLKDYMVAGLFFHISQMFQVHTESMMELCTDNSMTELDELKKIKFIIQETSDLINAAEDLAEFASPILAALGSSIYLMLSISGIAILVQSQETGWVDAILQSLIYPTYVLCILLLWGYIGVYWSDSIEGFDQAMYECNWVDASQDCKTLIKMYKVRFIDPVYIRGGPFFRYNYELVSEVLKKAYYLLTLLADRILDG